jgi:hypothetical protein
MSGENHYSVRGMKYDLFTVSLRRSGRGVQPTART